MLKHVQISPMRSRSDSLSMRSSTSCASSLCGSPEPPNDQLRSHSRASSYSSLNETIPQTTIKIYTACLRQDIEYKTLGISYDATSKGVVQQLLRRCKMRHRDPRLFYLTMEVTVRRPGVKSVLELDDEARPALLQACHPKGDSRFCLQQRPGGLIRVHTSALQPNSQYKSLLISEETTSDELLSLLLSCYNSLEPVEQFSLYEVCPGQEYQRKLHPDDLPLKTQLQRQQKGEIMHFLVRRNPNYPRRRGTGQLLATIAETKHFILNSSLDSSTAGGVLQQQQQQSSHHLHPAQFAHHRLSLHSTSFSLGPAGTPTNTFISDIVDGLSSLNDLPAETKSLCLKESSFVGSFPEPSLDDSTASTDSTDSGESSSSSASSSSSFSSFSSLSSDSSSSSSSSEPDVESRRNASQNNNNDATSPCHQCPTQLVPTWRHSEPTELLHGVGAPPEIKSKNSAQHQQPPPRPAKSSSVQLVAALSSRPALPASSLTAPSYNPVYNIREIRTVSHSFSSLGIDKKLVDIRASLGPEGTPGSLRKASSSATGPVAVKEMVNTDPAKGVGNFVYI
uniref:Ras-associating domain-containing protein n=1 Tax=Anopheles atroparvus TaxID=41427 RepID=A0AAG5DHW6_ANOAO